MKKNIRSGLLGCLLVCSFSALAQGVDCLPNPLKLHLHGSGSGEKTNTTTFYTEKLNYLIEGDFTVTCSGLMSGPTGNAVWESDSLHGYWHFVGQGKRIKIGQLLPRG